MSDETSGVIVGFTAWRWPSPGALAAARTAQARVVGPFAQLTTRTISVGATTVDVWGRGALESRVRHAPDGSVLMVIGAPPSPVDWRDVPQAFVEGHEGSDAEVPWEGRVVLLHVSANGEQWTLWNDWLGAIPVFHARGSKALMASTLEPAVVSAMGYTSSDFRLSALLCLLINGHLISDWTLYGGMRTVRPDVVARWGDDDHTSRPRHTVVASSERWETPWDTLVDEMHARATGAIGDALRHAPAWTLALSGGLDSRLIACVGAALGADVSTCAWGPADTVDVVCSRKIASTLGLPWRRVDLGTDYLISFTRRWADWFGSAMHVHGMYQMAFYEAIARSGSTPILSGFINDVLTGVGGRQTEPARGQLYDEWYGHWTIEELRRVLRVPIDEALAELAAEIERQLTVDGGAPFQRDMVLELSNRCPLFVGFQVTLAEYWRGAAAPFMNRDYARFCLSLPRPAVDDRRLLHDVFRRFYPAVAAIPGTFGLEPMLVTGRHQLARRAAVLLPRSWRKGPLNYFGAVQPRMDCDALRASGCAGLWPIPEVEARLDQWLDVSRLRPFYERAVSDEKDYQALRRLQSVQTLAYRLLDA